MGFLHHSAVIISFWYASAPYQSDEFGRAIIIPIMARCSQAKIPMVTPNEPGTLLNSTKKYEFTIPKLGQKSLDIRSVT